MAAMIVVGTPCVILALFLAWRFACGPYWLGINSDPAYQYLMNSLYLADHRVPLYFQHPGTPVQLLGAVIIKLLNYSLSDAQMVEKVLQDPEFYLHAMYAALAIFYTLTLMALALYAYQRSRDLMFAFLVQTPAFLYLNMGKIIGFVSVSTNVCPESLLAGLLNIYGICLLKAYFTKEKTSRGGTAFCWGMVYGLLVATKFTSLALLAIPLGLLPSLRDRALFCLAAAAAFILATSPVCSRYPSMWGNLYQMLTHTQFRGNGPKGLIAWGTFCGGMTLVFKQLWFLMTSVLLASGFIFYHRIFQGHGRKLNKAHYWAAWTAGTIVLQFFIVAKETAFYYMVPAIGISGIFWALFYLGSGGKPKTWALPVVFFTALSLALNFVYLNRYYKITHEMQAFSKELYGHNKGVICGYYRSSSIPFALVFGDNSYGLRAYEDIIQKLYPENYSMDIGQFKMDEPPGVYLEDALANGQPVFLYGSILPESFFGPLFQVKRMAQSSNEAVYQVLSANDKKAYQTYFMAELALRQGQGQIAYGLGLKARDLGLPAARDFVTWMDGIIAKGGVQ